MRGLGHREVDHHGHVRVRVVRCYVVDVQNVHLGLVIVVVVFVLFVLSVLSVLSALVGLFALLVLSALLILCGLSALSVLLALSALSLAVLADSRNQLPAAPRGTKVVVWWVAVRPRLSSSRTERRTDAYR